jgi:hypothetical protein
LHDRIADESVPSFRWRKGDARPCGVIRGSERAGKDQITDVVSSTPNSKHILRLATQGIQPLPRSCGRSDQHFGGNGVGKRYYYINAGDNEELAMAPGLIFLKRKSHNLFYHLPIPSSASRKSIPPISLYHPLRTPSTAASTEVATVTKYWIQWRRAPVPERYTRS